jgi:hypothetical protein
MSESLGRRDPGRSVDQQRSHPGHAQGFDIIEEPSAREFLSKGFQGYADLVVKVFEQVSAREQGDGWPGRVSRHARTYEPAQSRSERRRCLSTRVRRCSSPTITVFMLVPAELGAGHGFCMWTEERP